MADSSGFAGLSPTGLGVEGWCGGVPPCWTQGGRRFFGLKETGLLLGLRSGGLQGNRVPGGLSDLLRWDRDSIWL